MKIHKFKVIGFIKWFLAMSWFGLCNRLESSDVFSIYVTAEVKLAKVLDRLYAMSNQICIIFFS